MTTRRAGVRRSSCLLLAILAIAFRASAAAALARVTLDTDRLGACS